MGVPSQGGAYLPKANYDRTGATDSNGTYSGATVSGATISGTTAIGAGATLTSPTVNSPTITSPTITGTTAIGAGATLTSPALVSPSITGVIQENGAAQAAGAASQIFSSHVLADNSVVDFFTVTVPNAIMGGAIYLNVSSSLGDGDSTDSATYCLGISRIAGAATKAVLGAKTGAGATAGATGNAVITASVSAMTGAVSATQTFTVQFKNARSAGSATNHPTTAIAYLVNHLATGITIAAI